MFHFHHIIDESICFFTRHSYFYRYLTTLHRDFLIVQQFLCLVLQTGSENFGLFLCEHSIQQSKRTVFQPSLPFNDSDASAAPPTGLKYYHKTKGHPLFNK